MGEMFIPGSLRDHGSTNTFVKVVPIPRVNGCRVEMLLWVYDEWLCNLRHRTVQRIRKVV